MIVPLLFMAAEPQVDCARAVTQTDMNICAYRDYEAADRALNAAWSKAAAKARASGRNQFARLLDAQRKWLAYRDAQCLAENGPREESGTIWPLQQNTCMQRLTEARTAQLREYVETEN
jgi:uncharacterized protein YecT (DUF1311 family)